MKQRVLISANYKIVDQHPTAVVNEDLKLAVEREAGTIDGTNHDDPDNYFYIKRRLSSRGISTLRSMRQYVDYPTEDVTPINRKFIDKMESILEEYTNNLD